MGAGLSARRYGAALDYLFARTTAGLKLGLERTVALLAELGDPQLAFPVLHVAGTNGKGSSVATAEAVLRGKGLRVGRYTSPHLVDFRERIVVDGALITEDEVIDFVGRWTPSVERIGATFFEATTALAFEHFARQRVDVALVETGLGGRLDSTNVVDPRAAGVTTIGFDHMEYLGDTLEAIADEKAGIFKAGRPAVVGESEPLIQRRLVQAAMARGAAPIRVVPEEFVIDDVEVTADGTSFGIQASGESARLTTPLVGRHQATNVAFALALLDAAGPPFRATLAEAATHLPLTRIPGRFQRHGRFVFDVAHNVDGIVVLARTLSAVQPERPVVALFCALRDKDWRGMLRALAPVVDHVVLTSAPTAPASRAWDPSEALTFARDDGISAEAIPDLDAAMAFAGENGATIVVTGSFHTVGDVMARLQVAPQAG